MTSSPVESVAVSLGNDSSVSALWQRPAIARACLALAHGAGAGMRHSFMEALASELEACGIATLRYQFPYMEKGSKRPDPPPVCHATVRAAAAKAHELAPDLPLLAGGKSFGGRMTSQAQAAVALDNVKGLIFVGFPLHPPGRPSIDRAQHLFNIRIPMLFLQGTRDELADLGLLEPLIKQLGPPARLIRFQQADHSFHVPARSGTNDARIRSEVAQAVLSWMESTI